MELPELEEDSIDEELPDLIELSVDRGTSLSDVDA